MSLLKTCQAKISTPLLWLGKSGSPIFITYLSWDLCSFWQAQMRLLPQIPEHIFKSMICAHTHTHICQIPLILLAHCIKRYIKFGFISFSLFSCCLLHYVKIFLSSEYIIHDLYVCPSLLRYNKNMIEFPYSLFANLYS